MTSNLAGNDDDHILDQLRNSIKAIVAKTGSHSQFAKDLTQRIGEMQNKLDALTDIDRHQFIAEMKDSLQATIGRIEQRITQHANLTSVYSSSIVSAMIFLLVAIFALFGYKLYKSLTEKELKKQKKLESKQQKKSKKSN
ncbi:uncharacterized protein [Drosophila tropicalis]|uniref:uncharacterized protein isoform X2 n=1 Tax=Drosophila tropicalis TaxID=46794 RepID=UPI0035ABAC7E